MKFTSTQKVKASMAGSDGYLSMTGAFQIVQDTITEFMGDLHIDGITVKQKFNAFWVFVKTRVMFFKKLCWNEEYVVTAFISAVTAAKMHLDVKVCDKTADTVFHSRTEMCVLDFATQRIKKVASVGVDESMRESEEQAITFGKWDVAELTFCEQVRVRSTNIDHSHHTNNLEYMRFVMNTYTAAELENLTVREMEVVYASQSYENDTLDVFKTARENSDYVVLQKDGKTVVKCEIVFER